MKKKMLLGVVLGTLLVGIVAGAILWTSTEVAWHARLEGVTGAIFDITLFDNYRNEVTVTSIQDGYNDMRDNSFLIVVYDTNIDGDMMVSVSVTGIPTDCVVTGKLVYAIYMEYDPDGNPANLEEKIILINSTGGQIKNLEDGQGYVYRDVPLNPLPTDPWYSADLSGGYDVPINSGYVTIPHANITQAFYDTVLPSIPNTASATHDKANGLWLSLSYDTSAMSQPSGNFEMTVTASLGEV